MIGRIWHGYTTPENANVYEELLRNEIFINIRNRHIDGFQEIQLFRRELNSEVEFITIMWFDSVEAIRAFAGEDYEVAVVPPKARAVLSHFDERSQHYEVRERGKNEVRMIRKLAHINFVTNDLERIIDFYVNKLDMKIKFTLNNQEGKPFGYYFECGDTTFLEFFDQAMAVEVWGGKVEELNIGTRYKHFCLEVTGLDEFCKTLKSRGVAVSEIKLERDNSRQAWITDPDGNSIELMEYGPSSLQLTG